MLRVPIKMFLNSRRDEARGEFGSDSDDAQYQMQEDPNFDPDSEN